MMMKTWTACFLLTTLTATAQTTASPDGVIRVDITPSHSINSFNPDQALGSSVDVLSRSGIDHVYTPHILEESLSAGWGPISYRNNSELRKAAWHWNPNGAWSDPANKDGYFTGSSDLVAPIKYILSYSLPHRGICGRRRSSLVECRPHVLEKQSVSHQQIHRRKRREASAVGGARP